MITIPWDVTDDYIRSGHGNEDSFDQDSFRTISIDEDAGIKAVIGCPKGHYSDGKCDMGTKVQSYLFVKDKWTLERAKAWFEKHEKESALDLITFYKDNKLVEAATETMSDGEIRDLLMRALPSQKDIYYWIVDTYSNKFIYERDDGSNFKTFEQGYAIVDGKAELMGEPVEVIPRKTYVRAGLEGAEEDEDTDEAEKLYEFIVTTNPDVEIKQLSDLIGGMVPQHRGHGTMMSVIGRTFNEGLPDKVSKEQLEKGVEVEMEHVDKEHPCAKLIALKIALDHLAEDSEYYTKLEEVEGKAASKKAAPLSWRVAFKVPRAPRDEKQAEQKFEAVWESNDQTYPVEMIVIDDSRNANDWAVPREELENIAGQMDRLQLRINHSRNRAEDVKGVFTGPGEIINDGTAVKAKALILDKDTAKKVHYRALRDISLSGSPEKAVCSECGKSTLFGWECECEDAWEIISGVKLGEGSIVTDGAYDNTKILGFAASVNNWRAKRASRKPTQESSEMKSMEKDAKEAKLDDLLVKAGKLVDRLEGIVKRKAAEEEKKEDEEDEEEKKEAQDEKEEEKKEAQEDEEKKEDEMEAAEDEVEGRCKAEDEDEEEKKEAQEDEKEEEKKEAQEDKKDEEEEKEASTKEKSIDYEAARKKASGAGVVEPGTSAPPLDDPEQRFAAALRVQIDRINAVRKRTTGGY